MAYSNAPVFTLVSANLNTAQMINIFSGVIQKIDNFTTGNQPPFIAKIYKDATVKLWKNHNQLNKLLKEISRNYLLIDLLKYIIMKIIKIFS